MSESDTYVPTAKAIRELSNGPFPPAPPRPELSAEKLGRLKTLASRKALRIEAVQEALDGRCWENVASGAAAIMTIEAEMRGIES